MWEDLLFKIILTVISAVFTSFVVPCIVKLGNKASDSRKRNFFKTLVSAAEEMFGGKSGSVKDGYVKRQASKKYGRKMDSEELSSYIEDAVKQLKEADKEYKAQSEHQKRRYKEEKELQERNKANVVENNNKSNYAKKKYIS